MHVCTHAYMMHVVRRTCAMRGGPQPDGLSIWWPKKRDTYVADLRSGLVRCRGHARTNVTCPKTKEMSLTMIKINYP